MNSSVVKNNNSNIPNKNMKMAVMRQTKNNRNIIIKHN